jgi:hypothetical protein
MTQSFWESEVEEQAQTAEPEQAQEQASPPEHVQEHTLALAREHVLKLEHTLALEHVQEQEQQQVAETAALALSVDEFSALEERVLRTVNLVKRERLARAAADERATLAEVQLRQQAPLMEQQQQELSALRAERDHVRQRVERLLSQLDALEL